MVKVIFVEPGGDRRAVDAVAGDTLMTTGTSNLVDGLVGECGGGLSCGTCHVFVDADWADAVGGPVDDERDMLETTAVPATATSRLSCQIVVGEALDGLIVHVPESQY